MLMDYLEHELGGISLILSDVDVKKTVDLISGQNSD